MIGIYQAPGANAVADAEGGARARWPSSQSASPRTSTTRSPTTRPSSSRETIEEVMQDADRGLRAGRASWCSCSSATCRATLIPLDRRAGQSLIGTFAVLLADRLFRQHRLAARAGARHRHRRRRRHRRGRERRAGDGGASRALAGRGDQAGHGRDHRADHRHHAGAAVGVRAGRRSSPAFPASCSGSSPSTVSVVDADLGDQRADAVAGAVRRAAASRTTGRGAASMG